MLNIHFSEIILKGRNRGSFERLLLQNISSSMAHLGKFDIVKKEGRILISAEDEGAARLALMKTFGIDSVSLSVQAKPDMDDIESVVLSHSKHLAGKKIKVETKRAYKKFPFTSPHVNVVVGKALVDAGCTVDLESPDETIFVEILSDRALVSFERHKGLGGLPVGASGKVLSLLSGGIDSPVSSWLMMKRGCTVDFLHMHSFAANKDIHDSKIAEIIKSIRQYSPARMRLFVAPYSEFYKKSISLDPKSELVVFRRFLLRLASRLARKHDYKGMVTGDSIGQVASQTLDNIFATDEASSIPVLRPLVAFNKQEIVDLAVRIGTYKSSIGPYKDCCSLVAHKSPSTGVRLETAKRIEQEMGIEEIVEKTLEQCDVLEF
jgi:thiamine biosynthesis protein ThiI